MKHLENNIFWICLVELLFICDCLLLTQREIGKCGQPWKCFGWDGFDVISPQLKHSQAVQALECSDSYAVYVVSA